MPTRLQRCESMANGPMETKYNGKLDGDELKLNFEARGNAVELTAKRSKT